MRGIRETALLLTAALFGCSAELDKLKMPEAARDPVAPTTLVVDIDPTLLLLGRQLYTQNCSPCHATDLSKESFGPNHRNLFGNLTQTKTGLKLADANYIARSLTDPTADEAVGKAYWSPSQMPEFRELTKEQQSSIITYLKSISIPQGAVRNPVNGELSVK